MKKLIFMVTAATALLSGCQGKEESAQPATTELKEKAQSSVAQTASLEPSLASILDMQDEKVKERFKYRNPKETLDFFGIKPGMTVVEALPGGGWYSKILQSYLGSEGELIGVDYSYDMWPNFSFADENFLNKKKTWSVDWPKGAQKWSSETGSPINAYTFSTLPQDLQADAVLFIRALHNLSRFEAKGEFLTKALSESHRILKSGGIVGVVQHQLNEEHSDASADGSRGYLKKSRVVASFEKAGFILVGESDINKNAKDQPGEKDIVWRLPPRLTTSKDDDALKQKYTEIGESNRMTLLFVKK